MAAVSASMASTAPILRTEFSGSAIQGLPALASPAHLRLPAAPLTIRAGTGKKVQSKEPVGPSGENKFRNGVDASGRKATGKGVYQYTNKYGVNVDGYSPIYTPEEWSANGDTYAGGVNGLILWAITLGAVLLGGVLLVYNTSALAQ